MQIKKRIVCGKEAFLLSDLLENIKGFCEENGIEGTIITNTKTWKRKIIDAFPEKI